MVRQEPGQQSEHRASAGEVSLCGLRLANPTILASGLVGISGAACVYAAQHGAGAIVPKSVGPRERAGHANPVLTEFEGGFLNAVGLPNSGADNSIGELEFAMQHAGVPIIVSIFGGTRDEYGAVARTLSVLEPPMIEVNLSCPNTTDDFGTPFALDPREAADVIRVVKDNTAAPVSAKLAPNVPDIGVIARAVVEAGADAITAINTMPGMAIDVRTAQPILHNMQGGVSGHALKPIAVNCVYDIHRAVDVPIIGIGGVTTGEDAVEMIMAGATAVGIGTGVYYRGMDVFQRVAGEIASFMAEEGYASVDDMRGLAHRG